MKKKFSKPIIADKEAYYMSCPEIIGKHLARQLSNFSSALELCSAVGMTAIQLAEEIDKVIAVDISPERIEYAKLNAELYGVENKIEFVTGDALDPDLLKSIAAEVAILDPDWSAQGEEKSSHVNNINDTQPSLKEMFNLTKQYITPNIVIRVPKNFTFNTLAELGCCRLENILWEENIKFKFAYFLNDIKNSEETNFYFD